MTDKTSVSITETARAIQASIRPAQNQLDLALGTVEGIAATSVKTAIMLIQQVEEMVIELTNKDADDYDELVGQLEDLQTTASLTAINLKELTEKYENLEITHLEEEAAHGRLKSDNQLKLIALREAEKELKRLVDMKPQDLKSKNIALKKESSNKSDIINKQLTEIRNLKKAKLHLEKSNAGLTQVGLETADHVRNLEEKLTYSEGYAAKKVYKANEQEGLYFYVYHYSWGLYADVDYNRSNYELKIVRDVDWHIKAVSTMGIDLLILCSEWLSPIMPVVTEIKDELPQTLIDDLHVILADRCADSHPKLVERMEWAKEFNLSDVEGITAKQLDLLNEYGFHTIYDVVETRKGRVNNRCKGIGKAAEDAIRCACWKVVKAWESENDFTWSAVKKEKVAA